MGTSFYDPDLVRANEAAFSIPIGVSQHTVSRYP